jgi:hypothetical protein
MSVNDDYANTSILQRPEPNDTLASIEKEVIDHSYTKISAVKGAYRTDALRTKVWCNGTIVTQVLSKMHGE